MRGWLCAVPARSPRLGERGGERGISPAGPTTRLLDGDTTGDTDGRAAGACGAGAGAGAELGGAASCGKGDGSAEEVGAEAELDRVSAAEGAELACDTALLYSSYLHQYMCVFEWRSHLLLPKEVRVGSKVIPDELVELLLLCTTVSCASHRTQ